MRTKKLVNLLVIVLCIVMLTTSLLVACKDKTTVETPPPEKIDYLPEVMESLQNSFYIEDAKRFYVDILATAKLDETVGNKDNLFNYEFLVKANVNLTEEAFDDDTSMRIELNSINALGVKSTLFGILFESELDDKDKVLGNYFYLTIAGAEPIKVNAFSLKKLVNLIAPTETSQVADLDINTILQTVLSLFLNDGEKIDNNYIFDFSLIEAWSTISNLIGPMLQDPTSLDSMLGIPISQYLGIADMAVKNLFGDLTYLPVGSETTKNVESLSDMVTYLDQNMPNVLAKITFKFDNDFIFNGLTCVATYQKFDSNGNYNAPTHNFNFDLSKILIGEIETVEVDAGYPLTAAERKAIKDISNILNFQVNGTINLGHTSTDPSNLFDWSLNMNLNPFVLFNGTSIAELKNLGYFSFEMNYAQAGANGNEHFEKGENLVTLHANFSEGRAYISFGTSGSANSLITERVFLGGTYDFNALTSLINTFLAPAPATISEAANTEPISIQSLLIELISNIDFSNITENGLKFSGLDDLTIKLLDFAGISIPMGGNSLVAGILWNWQDGFTIKVNENGFIYQGCKTKDSTELDLQCFNRDEDGENTLANVVKDTVSTNAIQTSYEYGDPFKINLSKVGSEYPNSFDIKAKNLLGQFKDFRATFMTSTFDPYKVGTQKVTVYYGINSKLGKLYNNSMLAGPLMEMLPSTYPIFGCQSFTIDCTVYAPIISDSTAVIYSSNSSTTLWVDEDISQILNAKLRYKDANGQIREKAIDKNMISCNKPVIEDGKFKFMGQYTLDINYFNAHAQIKIKVNELIPANIDTIYLGQDLTKELDLKACYIDDNGNIVNELVQVEPVKLIQSRISDGLYPKEIPLLELFLKNDSGEMTSVVRENFNLISTTMHYTLTFSYEVNDVIRYRDVVFKVSKPADLDNLVQLNSMIFQNTDLSAIGRALTKIVKPDGTEYFVIFDNITSTWIAKTKTGTIYDGDVDVKIMLIETVDGIEVENEVEITPNKTLSVGKYNYYLTVGDSTFKRTSSISINPIVDYKDYSYSAVYLYTLFKFNIDSNDKIPGYPTYINTCKLAWKDGSWQIVTGTKVDVNGDTNGSSNTNDDVEVIFDNTMFPVFEINYFEANGTTPYTPTFNTKGQLVSYGKDTSIVVKLTLQIAGYNENPVVYTSNVKILSSVAPK